MTRITDTEDDSFDLSKLGQKLKELLFIVFHAAVKVHRVRFYQAIFMLLVLYIQNLYFLILPSVSFLFLTT